MRLLESDAVFLERVGTGISIKHGAYERAIRQLATARDVSLAEAVWMAVR